MTRCGKHAGWVWVLSLLASVGCGGRTSDERVTADNGAGAPSTSAGDGDSGGAAALPPPEGPFAVSQYFSPSLMGDGATPGKIRVDINDHCKTRPDGARGACYRFVYTLGDVAWGGAEWLIGGTDGGQTPGLPIPGASLHHVSFYAAEDGGSDIVNFVIGGVSGPAAVPPGAYQDTLEQQVSETLTSDWQKFDIDIPPTSDFQPPITSLLGAFTWAVNWTSSGAHPATAPPKTIYIDDLVYE